MIKPIYFLLIVILNNSCIQKQENTKETLLIDSDISLLPDTLKFTSGISTIFQDSKKNYWIGSKKEGICFYDGQSYEYFTVDDGLPHNQINAIQEDHNGTIWFSSAHGIGTYNGQNFAKHQLSINTNSQKSWDKTTNDLWFPAGNKEGIYRFDGQKLNYLAFPDPKIINPNNVYFTTCISKGKNNMVWIGTYAGIFGYNGEQFTIINDETLGLNVQNEPLHIRSILEDSKGRLWVGNNGIGVLLIEKGSIVNFSKQNNLIHPTSSMKGDKSQAGTLEHVFAIEEDGEGNIWFGDRDTGIWKYNGNTMTNYTKKEGLTDDFVVSIYNDKENKLWVLLADGNIFSFNGKTFDKQF